MQEIHWVEKRRAIRARSSMPAYYDSIEYGKHGNGLTNDLSETGVRVTLEEFIPKFSKVSLRITLKPDKLIQLNGKVRWTERIAYSPRYQIGLEFESVSPDARRSIAEYVYTHKK